MREMRKFAQFKRISITSVYGGASMGRQIQQLRRTDIVVGTPGRILDHIERRTLHLNEVNTLVLDEADRMLDMGFIKDMKKIIQHVPKERQTLLFSATFSPEIQEIAAQHMKHAQLIKAQTHVDKGKLTQVYYDLDTQGDKKLGLLIHILKHENPPHAIVFGGTRRNVDRIERSLNDNGVRAESIHGGLSQNQRKRTLNAFHHGDVHVLVASDVAARGLDIKNVSHVINYDIPRTPEDYIHRSGRTARAGEEGKIISLLTPNDYAYFRSIIRDKSHHITQEELPAFENITFSRGKKHAHAGENKTTHFSREKPHYKGKPGSFPPRRKDEKQFNSQRKPFDRNAQHGKTNTRFTSKKPFDKRKKYEDDEEYTIVKHFGLKHAKE
jgi:ATP-dependent RNA helicase DeaD